MDLNELFSRHQVAMIGMVHAASPSRRASAEQCANYYADRIDTVRGLLTADHTIVDHQDLKRIVRG